MLVLKNGGTAVDAVEAAIKTLEDREITNAGYGSNLAMDGVVECDAAIVDHHGRSGAVGAVARESIHDIASLTNNASRNQESHFFGSLGARAYHALADSAARSTEPTCLSGRDRFRCRNGHADPASRCSYLTSRERALA